LVQTVDVIQTFSGSLGADDSGLGMFINTSQEKKAAVTPSPCLLCHVLVPAGQLLLSPAVKVDPW
jgi:hypothetical protein